MSLVIEAKPSLGFWRCGVFHPSEKVTHHTGVFSSEQVKVLKKEKMLVVYEKEDPKEEAEDKVFSGGKKKIGNK